MQFQASLLKELGPSTDSVKHWRRQIKLRTKTFQMMAQAECGIVGMGLRARRSAAEALAIDSTLTACANIIRSVKALAAYTKEVERFATRDPQTNLYNHISF